MNLNQMLDTSVEKYPRSVAIVDQDATINYRALKESVNRMAKAFLTLGIKEGDTVAIILRNSSEFIIAYFALMRIGAIAVPINYLLKPLELEFILHDAGAVGIVTHLNFFHEVKTAGRNVPSVRFFIIVGDTEQINVASCQEVFHQAVFSWKKMIDESSADRVSGWETMDPERVAMFLYTSGTTGKPKGVMITHRNLVSNMDSCVQATGVCAKDKFICILPMFHSFALLVCVLLPLNLGATSIVIPSIKPFGNIMKSIFHQKVTVLVGVPQIFSALAKIPFFWPFRVLIPVRLCISGAAPLPPQVLKRFEKKFRIPLLEGYGLTETSPVVALNPVSGSRKEGSIGIPIPQVEVMIADEHGADISQTRLVGELFVKGRNVMKGYRNRPEETAAVLTANGWLKTGDMGYIDEDGYLYIVDRKKDLIISKGLNIYPKEVEDILLGHPSVAEAAVIGIRKADGDEIVLAYITLREGKSTESKEILKYCREHIASYKVPREIIIKSELPKNTLGKVLKTVIREEASKKYKSSL